ncbi:uncharacterized protein BDV14DRAFT_190789 [Aspergillus stella-maris]|uniref:uncharacterized protein n=1 Tax=Aspergillus stella-maris TaxID=1810926 RepID=UPI003CCD2485
MAIPSDITLKTLNGSWTLDKSVSDSSDSILRLQGVSWLTRKAISAATLTLHFTSSSIETEDGTEIPQLTMRQTLTGGIPGSTEERVMDWVERMRSNHVYGDVLSKSKLVKGVEGESGAVKPEIEVQSSLKDEGVKGKIREFLTGGTGYLPTASEEDEKNKDLADLYIHDFGRSEKSGWTVEQIWALETINFQSYLTRRIAAVRGDEVELARLVYKFYGL